MAGSFPIIKDNCAIWGERAFSGNSHVSVGKGGLVDIFLELQNYSTKI